MKDAAPGSTPASRWTAGHVRALDHRVRHAPLLTDKDVRRVAADIDFWDAWPVQDADGNPSQFPNGDTLWMALGAPRFDDPNERHGHARIHLIVRHDGRWRHAGPVMPDGFSPGSREWSGSAVLDADRRELTLYFTATGRRGEAATTFEQRLFSARATLAGMPADGLSHWRDLREIVARDPQWYMASDSGTGKVGTIKAFRDPAYFRDPVDGRHHLFFAASLAGSASAFNGVIGSAVAPADDRSAWRITPPLVSADTLNNELERPHVVHRDGGYYLFWSTQRHVFDPAGPVGPTGLYGMVADHIDGAWRPLNGSGLVFANPPTAPRQAYSWLVMPDLQVTSFVDDWGSDRSEGANGKFGATFAPMLRIRLDGDKAGLADE